MPDELLALVHGWFAPSWVVRSRELAEVVTSLIRDEISRYDAGLPIADVRTIDDLSRSVLAKQRFDAQLTGGTAFVALFLAAVGLAGLAASSVEERRRELGLRMALGASRWSATRRAVAPGLGLTACGLSIGGLLTIPEARALSGLIWGIDPTDASALTAVVVILFLVAIVASAVPAIRVLKLDPVRALRDP